MNVMECKTGADVNAHNKAGNFALILPRVEPREYNKGWGLS